MPVEYRRSPIAGQLISSLIQQRFEREEFDRRSAEEQRLRSIEKQRDILQIGVEKGLNLDKLAPFAKDVPTDEFLAFKELAKGAKQQQQEQESLSNLMNPQQIAQIGQAGAARPDAGGRMRAPDQSAYQGGLEARASQLGGMGRPELVTQLVQQAEAARALTESEGAAGVAQEMRGEAAQNRLASASDARLQSRGRREAAVASESSALAAGAFGLGENFDISPEASAQRFVDAGYSPTEAKKMAAEAKQRSFGEKVELEKWSRSAMGKGVDTKLIEAQALDLSERFGVQPNADLLRKLTLQEGGKVVQDTWSAKHGALVWIPTIAAKDADRVNAKRRDLSELEDGMGMLTDAYSGLVQSGGAGPGTWEGMYDLASFFGNQPPEVAAFRNAAFSHAAALLKAAQGARPSEFDLKRYLALMPTLAEVGTPAGAEKLVQLQKMMELQRTAPFDPASRKALEKIDLKIKKIRSTVIDSVVSQARRELENTGSVSEETLSEFLNEAEAFNSGKAGNSVRGLLSPVLPSGLTPDDASLVDEY